MKTIENMQVMQTVKTTQVRAALVGKPNVGKSSLFNKILSRSRNHDPKSRDRITLQNPKAIVADYDGVTRDILYGEINIPEGKIILNDSPGEMMDDDVLHQLMGKKAREESSCADIILLVCDGEKGLDAADSEIARRIYTSGQECLVLVNKMDKRGADSSDFYSLGYPILPISATNGLGVKDLIKLLTEKLPAEQSEITKDQDQDKEQELEQGEEQNKSQDKEPQSDLSAESESSKSSENLETSELAKLEESEEEQSELEESEERTTHNTLALLGCPNSGKSTLANILLKADKQLVHHLPGSTRDSVYHPIVLEGEQWRLIDTAGIRRKSRIKEDLEQQTFGSAITALRLADLVVYVIDAEMGVRHQDLALLRLAERHGKGLVIAINKSDLLDQQETKDLRGHLDWELAFMSFAPRHFISAKNRKGLKMLFQSVQNTRASLAYIGNKSVLNRHLEELVGKNPPPMRDNKRSSLRFIKQVASNPPKLVIHGKRVDHLPDSYKKFIKNSFSDMMKLVGSPLVINYQNDVNPYAGKRS